MIQVLSNLLLKSMRLAEYFCTGTVMDKSKYAHYALAAPYYTHFTSPIRRYPDIMVSNDIFNCFSYASISGTVYSLGAPFSFCRSRF